MLILLAIPFMVACIKPAPKERIKTVFLLPNTGLFTAIFTEANSLGMPNQQTVNMYGLRLKLSPRLEHYIFK